MDVTRQYDRLYHDLLSPADVIVARARARELADRIVAPAAVEIANGDERVDGFPRAVFDALAAEGLFGVGFGSDVGGQGLDHPATADVTLRSLRRGGAVDGDLEGGHATSPQASGDGAPVSRGASSPSGSPGALQRGHQQAPAGYWRLTRPPRSRSRSNTSRWERCGRRGRRR